MKSFRFVLCFLLILLWGAGLYAQAPSPCPSGTPAGTSCFTGRDEQGAYYLIAIPENWNGTLVLYTPGGPPSGPAPYTGTFFTDYTRQVLPEGFAVAITTYRRGGFATSSDAEDAENLRQIFVNAFGRPKRTIVFGLSFGGPVANKVVELYGVHPDGSLNYEGALTTCGVMGGHRLGFYRWIDLRVVYQYYCQNHPRPDEAQYPLWMGLPPGVTMATEELRARINECTGVDLSPTRRSERQRRNLANILNVIRLPETELVIRMGTGTSGMQSLVQLLGGRNALTNIGVVYQGSDNDRALNRGVLRYRSDPEAAAELAADTDPTGEGTVPVLTVHGIGDERVIVENAAAYRQAFEQAGTLDYLLQTFVTRYVHNEYSAPEFQAVLHALLDWIETGEKPTHGQIIAACEKYHARLGGDVCRFDPTYEPASLESRVYPRDP